MAENIIVRKANHEDLDGILTLLNRPEADNVHALQGHDANTIYQSILEDSNYFQIIATSEQNLIDMLTLVIIMQMSHEGSSSALITDLIIQDSDQETAFALLKYATDLAEEYGCFKTILHCNNPQEEITSACKELGFKGDSGCLVLN